MNNRKDNGKTPFESMISSSIRDETQKIIKPWKSCESLTVSIGQLVWEF